MKIQRSVLFNALVVAGTMLPAATSLADDNWPGVGIHSIENDVDVRCSNDSLGKEEVPGRIDWSIGHYPKTVAMYYSYITFTDTDYETHYGNVASATAAARMDWMKVPNTNTDRPYPKYPLWMSDGKTPDWRAPKVANAAGDKPDDATIRAVCRSGCYKPAMRLLYVDGYKPIREAFGSRAPDIMTLAGDATLEAPTLTVGQVDRYTVDATDAHNSIVVIETAGGGRLELTENHPLVDDEGRMREASTFSVGESLVRIDGAKDEIARITVVDYYGKVYNLIPKGSSLKGNVVVAEGFLSGSAWYQNDGAEYLDRDLFRLNLPDALVD